MTSEVPESGFGHITVELRGEQITLAYSFTGKNTASHAIYEGLLRRIYAALDQYGFAATTEALAASPVCLAHKRAAGGGGGTAGRTPATPSLFARLLREWREAHGLTAAAGAELCGVAPSVWRRWETGARVPDMALLARLEGADDALRTAWEEARRERPRGRPRKEKP